MTRAPSKAIARKVDAGPMGPLAERVDAALAWLRAHASAPRRDEMGPRYGIHTDHALGVSMADLQRLARELGRHHELAAALWSSGIYEARLLAALVDEPERVTAAQMDRWCRDFDNWGICDTVCMHLFDRSPHAFSKVDAWCAGRGEFVRRAGFALLASLALHDRGSDDTAYLERLPLVEQAADDERNFVKKAVSWALRAIGSRNPQARAAAVQLARRLAASADATPRWIGKDVLRALASAATLKRVARRA